MRSRAASTSPSSSSFSAPSFMEVAWYMDSSLTVAMILRVTPLSLPWYSFTFLASSRVSARPSDACALSLSLSPVISSRISSFSSRASFLSFRRSSSCWILALSSSLSGIFPSSSLHLLWLPGFSRATLRASASLRVSSRAFCSRATSSSRRGIWGTSLMVTAMDLSSSQISMFSSRISSSRRLSSSTPLLTTSSCMLCFSYRMQSSSFRSMSMMPV
mmetsp:Transcript_40583/g.90207  ORF Transcript_40583/g.90207 Transcript_40583/m.90207 type:complete len:217 (+) Transcript_40583:1227-1877(+)